MMNTIDPRQRYPELSMTEEEAQCIMQFEKQRGQMFSCVAAVKAALTIERATPEEFQCYCDYLGVAT